MTRAIAGRPRRCAPRDGAAWLRRGVGVAAFLLAAGCGREATGPGPTLPGEGPPTFVREFGRRGTINTDFAGLVAGDAGQVWVTQTYPARLWNFDADGRVLHRFDLQPLAATGVFLRPGRVARGPDGSFWIIDDNRNVLLHVAPDGGSLTTIADGGDPYGRLGDLQGVAVNSEGRVYVLDADARRVLVYSPQGERLFQFGRRGVAAGTFEYPRGLVLDAAGDVYLFDAEFAAVLHFRSDGTFVDRWARPGYAPEELSDVSEMGPGPDGSLCFSGGYSPIRLFTRDGVFLRAVTVQVECDGRRAWKAVAPVVLATGDYLALDDCKEAVHRFDAAGHFITRFSGSDAEAYSVGRVGQVALDERGHAYTVDHYRGTVLEFDASGERVRGPDLMAESPYDPYAGVSSIAFDGQGGFYRVISYETLILRTPLDGGGTDTLSVRLPGDLYDHRPSRLAVDEQGRLFVAVEPGQIRVFDRAGSSLAAWEIDLPADLGGPAPGAYHADLVDLRLAPDGTLWVLDRDVRRLVHYGPLGQPLGDIRFVWEGVEAVRDPLSFALSPDGQYVDVVNGANGKIYRFTLAGQYLYRWGSAGQEPGAFCYPTSIAWDARGNLYVADGDCARVNVYAY